MSRLKATTENKVYFITTTIVDWIDLFTRKNQKHIITDALVYCQKNKGLEIYGWCLMPSHFHMICSASEGFLLSDIIRDFKKFTSKKIIQTIKDEPESRREWLLEKFSKAPEHLKRAQNYKVWQNGYYAEELYSHKFTAQKLNYIHQNLVVDQIVEYAEDYIFSSARNYAGRDAIIEVNLLTTTLKTVV